MKSHEFTVVLGEDPDDDQADLLYQAVDDGTLATIAGVPRILFHRDATSLEEAIRSAIDHVRQAGLSVVRVEIEPRLLAKPA